MSYSRNYSAEISYSGSVSVSYPASQSGGSTTAHYSGTIPVDVTINVDTEPFDNSVHRFNNSVDFLSGTVAAMNAAQCAAIKKTADEISASLINGFFNTINTELSQQIQAYDSEVKAVFGLILEQGKAVTDKKNQMETDYNRISSRYIQLFSDLDTECYKRIYALDKQSFVLSEKVQRQLLSGSSCNTTAANLLGIEEVSSSNTFIFISSINRRVFEVLKTMHDYINQESIINSLVNSLLFDEKTNENTQLCIPVIWTESDLPEGSSTINETYMQQYLDPEMQQGIAGKVNKFCNNASELAFTACAESERNLLNREFNILAESNFVDSNDDTQQRVYQTMLSLWQNSELLTIERSL